MVKIKYTDIVLIGNLHLIDIFTPNWFEKRGIQINGRVSPVIAPGMTFLSLPGFDLVATPNNIKIVIKKDSDIQTCINVLENYIDAAIDSSEFKALGLNFIWESKTARNIMVSIDGIKNMNKIFGEDAHLSYGAIFYNSQKDHRMRLFMDPVLDAAGRQSGFIFNFNFHYLIEKKSQNEISKILHSYNEQKEYSERITNTLSNKDKEEKK